MTQVQTILSITVSCIAVTGGIFFGFWKIGRDLKTDFEKKIKDIEKIRKDNVNLITTTVYQDKIDTDGKIRGSYKRLDAIKDMVENKCVLEKVCKERVYNLKDNFSELKSDIKDLKTGIENINNKFDNMIMEKK